MMSLYLPGLVRIHWMEDFSPLRLLHSGILELGKWGSPSYTMTNKGLYISFRLIKHWNNLTSLAAEDTLLAPLNCSRSN
jgi:hypothetical protein